MRGALTKGALTMPMAIRLKRCLRRWRTSPSSRTASALVLGMCDAHVSVKVDVHIYIYI